MRRLKVWVALAVGGAVTVGAWLMFGSGPRAMPLPIPIRQPAPVEPITRAPARLTYELKTDYSSGEIVIVNRDRRQWTHVHAEVGEGFASVQCPVPETIEPDQEVRLFLARCRSADGKGLQEAWVVRIAANEGGIVSGIEPGVPAR
jgi:hypothetical protein